MKPHSARQRFIPQHSRPIVPIRSWRAARIADWFGLTSDAPPRRGNAPDSSASTENPGRFPGVKNSDEKDIPPPAPGQILLLTGASGSGKSTLLRTIVQQLPAAGLRAIDLAAIELPDQPVVDCLPELSIEASLLLLGRMGLGEAWTYLRTPAELSDGQRWRLRLAMAVHEAGRLGTNAPVLVCDEFAALLDRITAAIVARAIRKLVTALPRLSAVLATGHDDLIDALCPDRIVRCDFGLNQVESTPDEHG